MEIHIGDRVAEVELVSKEDNKVVLTIDGKPFEADVVMAENEPATSLWTVAAQTRSSSARRTGKAIK